MRNIAQWLDELGLGQYRVIFSENDIEWEILPELSENDLEKLGLTLGHRKKLLKAIADLTTPTDAPSVGAIGMVGGGAPERYTPEHLVKKILASRESLEGERKRVTVLFADVQGSTKLIEGMDSEQAVRQLEPALNVMMDSVHRFEGTVNKVQGDGIMALFGAPLAHEDHAVRACYAALAMQQAMHTQAEETRRTHGVEIQARVGLHSGEVVVRTIGNDLSMDYDAVGPTVHLAKRMEELASPGSTRLTPETLRLAEGYVDVAALGPVPIKGFTEPVKVFELRGAGEAKTRLQAAATRGLTRFVGRQSELQTLNRALDCAGGDCGQIIAVIGEPGVGKSRLIHEFTRSHRAHDRLILESSAFPYGKSTAWLPVVDLLKSYFRVDARDDHRRIREKVTGKILTLDETLKPAVPAFLSLFDLMVDEPAWLDLDVAQRRRRTLEAIKALFLRESEVQPLIIIIEDLHWIDSESLSLLDGLVECLPASRILLLVNYRPEFAHNWGSRTHYGQLRIDPLPAQSVEELLGEILGESPGLTPLKSMLVGWADGNPLFLEESVRSLVEVGALTGESGAYRLTEELDSIEMPHTVHAIIASRIDRLDPKHKRLLQLAAVIGHDVPIAVLSAVAEMPEEQMQHALAALKAAEFLYEKRLFPDTEYTFKHAFTQEVAYSGLLEGRRRELHARVGEAIEDLYPDRQSELLEALAGHFEKGEVWAKAAAYHLRASEKAKEQYAYPNALDICRKALECTKQATDVDEERARSLVMKCDLDSLMGDLSGANACYDLAIELTTDPDFRKSIINKRHRRMEVERAGAKISYWEHGSSEKTIVLVFPLNYDIALFQPLVEKLCQEYRIVFIEPRGSGDSDPLPKHFSFNEQAADVRAVIEALNAGPITAVGMSLGGNILIKIAHVCPSLFSELILVGCPPDDGDEGTAVPRPELLRREFEEALSRGDYEQAVAVFVYSVISEPETRDLAEVFISSCLSLPRETFLALFEDDPERDIKPLLSEIRVPTLVTHGTADRRIPFDAARYITDRIPKAELYAFEGRGHLPIFTATREFSDVLLHFMQERTAPKRARAEV
jgi:class 3 adenylate cyclase/pimeloyl-ACP methyl ester carboxylesterase